MKEDKTKSILFIIFILSGFSGIIYESIWTHYLKLFLGHAAYAQTLVLAIFMGGMAIGALVCSAFSSRWKNLFFVYAVAEGIIGLSALTFHPLFEQFINFAYLEIIPGLNSIYTVQAFKWTFSSILILPQSILLGMTFPLMSAGIIRHFPESPGGTISMLYFTNSFGAAIGVLVSGFVLISLVGLPGTIVFAGFVNIGLALFVWRFSISHSLDTGEFLTDNDSAVSSENRFFYYFLSISFFTGMASFIYEIGWIRMLSLVLSSSTHSFEIMLSAFIFGLAFGGLWIRKRIEKISNTVFFLASVQIIMGVFAMSTLPLYGNTFNIMAWLMEHLDKTEQGYRLFNLSSHGIAVMVMFPATFCAGMTLPLITHVLVKKGHGERSIGAVYTANTLGAIAGIFIAIHIGMPYWGLKGLISSGALIDISMGLFLIWILAGRSRQLISVSLSLLSLVFFFLIFYVVELDMYKMSSGVYRYSKLLDSSKNKILYHRDGKTASVSLVEHEDGVRSIKTNGKTDASINMGVLRSKTVDETTMALLGAMPMMFNPNAKTAANIGFGSGMTSHVLLANPLLERVDSIEIESSIIEAARKFQPRNSRVYKDPRSSIYIDDAKTFFSNQNKRYDIIISEPSNPWVSGVSGLFSEQFYRLVKSHLTDEGIFVQWLQLYEIDIELVSSVFKALYSEFPYYEIYSSNYGDIIILATKSGKALNLDASLLEVASFKDEMEYIGVRSSQDVEARKVGTSKLFSSFFSFYPTKPNSDYYPVLDLRAPMARFLGSNAQGIISLGMEPIPLIDILEPEMDKNEKTDVTRSSHFPKSGLYSEAMNLRDFILFEKNRYDMSENKSALYKAQRFVDLLKNCNDEVVKGERISVIYNVSRYLATYLSKAEQSDIWTIIEKYDCSKIDSLEKLWISFFKALGNRSNKEIAILSKEILAKDLLISEARRKYILVAGAAAGIATEDKSLALDLLSDYKKYNQNDSGLLFPFLYSFTVNK